MPQDPPTWDADGTLHIPSFALPLSPAMSAEARAVLMKRASQPAVSVHAAADAGGGGEEAWLASMGTFRVAMEWLHRRLLGRLDGRYDVDIQSTAIDGVPVRMVTPRSGIPPGNARRILINLHGGAFVGGAEHCGLVESIPLACVAGIPIAVVDYRQGWEHRFPAASEDVATVYQALLEEHAPDEVGIFGYSAGGSLTAQAVAWFLTHDLPVPGAVAICSAGAAGVAGPGGDSSYLARVAMGDTAPAPVAADGVTGPDSYGYFAGVDPANRLVSPIGDPALLAQFPPALLLTGTRSFDQSGAVRTHRALLHAGVPAELHVWEGMWHCFAYNVEMPEAQDALRTLARFFDARLTPSPRPPLRSKHE